MLQKNPHFLVADMYIGIIHSSEEESEFELSGECEAPLIQTPWILDFGIDKTMQFQQNSGVIMHWNDDSIDPLF